MRQWVIDTVDQILQESAFSEDEIIGYQSLLASLHENQGNYDLAD
jgi:hypothetical protein